MEKPKKTSLNRGTLLIEYTYRNELLWNDDVAWLNSNSYSVKIKSMPVVGVEIEIFMKTHDFNQKEFSEKFGGLVEVLKVGDEKLELRFISRTKDLFDVLLIKIHKITTFLKSIDYKSVFIDTSTFTTMDKNYHSHFSKIVRAPWLKIIFLSALIILLLTSSELVDLRKLERKMFDIVLGLSIICSAIICVPAYFKLKRLNNTFWYVFSGDTLDGKSYFEMYFMRFLTFALVALISLNFIILMHLKFKLF